MATAESLIKAALQEILVQASEQPIEAEEFQTAVQYLNEMMAMLASDGINLGYSDVTNASDVITIPNGALAPVRNLLAVELATQYDVPLNQLLIAKSERGLRILEKIAVQPSPTSYPSTLPIGSGNEDGYSNYDKFYDPDPDTIDTEQGGVIGLEQLP